MPDYNKLLLTHKYLVTIAVRNLYPKVGYNWSADELDSFGMTGLLYAMQVYNLPIPDSPKDKHWRGFAIQRIRWHILDELRKWSQVRLIRKHNIHLQPLPYEVDPTGECIEYPIADKSRPEYPIGDKEEFEYLIRNLSLREKQIVRMICRDGMTYVKIGKRLGISESRVTQIFAKVRKRLSKDARFIEYVRERAGVLRKSH